jgi:WD40 repeat protein
MSDVFISYSRKDIAFARLIRESLQQSQIETWIDWERIPVGEKWWDEICHAIEDANVFMFIISNTSIGSPVCKDEIDHALKNHKRIIPILVDNLKPDAIKKFAPELPQLNWIIFERDQIFRIEKNPEIKSDKPEDSQVALPLPPQFEGALGKLSKAIHTDWEWVKYHTRLQVDALRWESNQRNPAYLVRGAALEESEQQLLRATAKDPQPTGLQVEYVTTSRQEETLRQGEQLKLEQKARQRQRLVIWAVGIGLVVAIVLGFVAWGQRNEAVRNRNEAVRNLARSESLRLSAEAENIMAQTYGNVETAALLSLRALQGGYLPQADAPLQKSLPRLYARSTFSGHADTVLSVVFSPDGRYVLTGSLDKTAKLWDAATGAEMRTFTGHAGSVESVAFSPDGKYVLTGSVDKTAKLWDAATGAELLTFSDPTSIVRTSVEMKRSSHSVAFSPDGKYVLTGSDDGTPKLWDAATGAVLRTFSGHTNIVRSVAFSPDGKYVLTGGLDDTARLWDAATGAEVRTFEHTEWVFSVVFSPDGKYVLTGGTGDLRLWNAATGELVRTFSGAAGGAIGVAFSPDGKFVLTGVLGGGPAKLWDVASGTEVRTFSGHTDSVNSVAFSPDGQYVLTGSMDKTAKLWNATSNAEVRTFRGHFDSVLSVAFSSDGKYVLTGSSDKTAKLWDAATYAEARTFSGHTDFVESVAFSPDGKYILTGSDDGTAKLWDAATYAVVHTFSGHNASVMSVAFSPDGKYVLTGSDDRTAKMWDAATGAEMRTFRGHTQAVIGVAFSPDGRYVLTGSIDWDAKLWDAATGAEVRTFKGDSSVEGVAFSPDGKYVLTGNYERTATLWDAATGVEVRTFSGHTSYVGVVAFSPDGKYVLTASGDFTAKLWDAATGVEVRTFGGHSDAVTGVAFSPDGKYVLTGSMDKTVELWDTDSNDTNHWACAHLTRDLTPEERIQYFITDNTPTCPNIGQNAAPPPPTTLPLSTPATLPTEAPVTPTPAVDLNNSSDTTLPSEDTLFSNIYISDAFNDNSNEWPVGNIDGNLWVGTRLIKNGVLDWDGIARQNMYSTVYPYPEQANLQDNLSDLQVSTRVNLVNPTMNGDFGLTLRGKEEERFYAFLADGNGYFAFFLKLDDEWKTLIDWKENPYLIKDGWNTMAVQATGSHFRLFFNDSLLSEVDDASLTSGQSGIIVETYEAGEKLQVQFDDFEVRLPLEGVQTPLASEEATTTSTQLEVTQNPNPAKFQPGGASGGAYTCAFKTSVKAVGAGVRIEKFGVYYWENNQWVHSTSNNGQPWPPEDFADWYSCPGAYIGPGQECSDPNNWTGADTPYLSKGKWYYVGVDDTGNEVQGEAVIECQP